ncbi:MAG: ABC transporter ATP-binding protein [Bdellovibrionales bacterium]|nr:ABC transporter ATP-binding protein [Bdellovibrionales bacterium]
MILDVQNVSLNYGPLHVLKDISFSLRERERLALVGPSGCGKSTLIGLIAGLRQACAGQILHRGQRVESPSRERVVIFQNHALFPWATALENVEFALRARGRKNVREEALHWLETMGLTPFAETYPKQLSGGMAQRVGLARALAADPDILLLDEPFSSLDVLTRDRLLEEVLPALTALGKTLILVTHSIDEALFVGDRVLCLSPRPGRIERVLETPFDKPRRLIEFKRQSGFLELEARLYSWLRGQEDLREPDSTIYI